jgi:hypothetical protein
MTVRCVKFASDIELLVQPLSSERDLFNAAEVELHEKETARRGMLQDHKSPQEIDAILEEEFEEQRRQLLCRFNALPRQS